jgi:peptidoglycan hydrolase-like protein with peptidoglycan-binding domain
MTWVAVPVSHTFHDGTIIKGTVYVAERALRIGEEGDSFRPTVNQVTAQRMADALVNVTAANAPDGVVLPTAKIIDSAAKASTVKVDPCLQSPSASMRDTDRMLAHSRCIDVSIGDRHGLSNQEGKAWRNTNALRGRPQLESNYGLFADNGRYRSVLGLRLWQPAPGTTHISGINAPNQPQGYTDYSQVCEKWVLMVMQVAGVGRMDIRDVARHPKYCWLISTEGPIIMRHPAVPDPDATVQPTPEAPRPAPPLLSRTLREGMRGEDVAFVQRIVGSKPDMIYGPKTTAAVKGWQRLHKDVSNRPLDVDGVVGPRTRGSMLADISGGIIVKPDAPSAFAHGAYDPTQAEYLEARHYNRQVVRDVVHWIVLHSAEAGEFPTTAEALMRYGHTMSDGRVASWNWAFDSDSATISVPEDRIAWHAKKANRFGVGYEQAGYARQTRDEWLDDYSESMLWIMATTAAKITIPRWGLPADNFVDADGLKEAYTYINAGKQVPDRLRGFTTHKAVSIGLGGNHTDPGKYYPKDKVLQFVKDAA